MSRSSKGGAWDSSPGLLREGRVPLPLWGHPHCPEMSSLVTKVGPLAEGQLYVNDVGRGQGYVAEQPAVPTAVPMTNARLLQMSAASERPLSHAAPPSVPQWSRQRRVRAERGLQRPAWCPVALIGTQRWAGLPQFRGASEGEVSGLCAAGPRGGSSIITMEAQIGVFRFRRKQCGPVGGHVESSALMAGADFGLREEK